MKKNLSRSMRMIRVLVAIVLVALYLAGLLSQTWGIVALIVAAIMLLTAVIGYCPLLSIFCNGSCPFSPKEKNK